MEQTVSPPRVALMGVSGSGKTTVGRIVAERLGAPFVDADDLHSAAAKAAMRAGRPLDDADRAPWLRRVRAVVRDAGDGPVVLACSALKRSYRDVLRDGVPGLWFVDLDVDADTLADRLAARAGHFAGPSLLPSQLATLELGDDVVRVDGRGTPVAVADRVLRAVGADPGHLRSVTSSGATSLMPPPSTNRRGSRRPSSPRG